MTCVSSNVILVIPWYWSANLRCGGSVCSSGAVYWNSASIWCVVRILFAYCILIADTKQQLRACLTPPSGPEKFGAISAVSINFDSTRLLVGHARGPVSYQ